MTCEDIYNGGQAGRANPDRRRHNRLLCSELVAVLWQDKRGRYGEAIGVLEDYSGHGANIYMSDSLDKGDSVRISANQIDFSGKVKSCNSAPNGFFIGLQFDEPLPDGCFTPEHVLDLSQFDDRPARASAPAA